MIQSPPIEIVAALARLKLVPHGTTPAGERLTGGVSSDIWRIDLPSGPICVKRALAKLRVAADWQAPVSRNLYEARWMQRADAAVAGAAPALLGQDPKTGVLAMQYLPPNAYPLWKNQLRDGHADPGFAAHVARSLVRIHSATAADTSIAADFPTDDIFFDIRLEPYLVATARAHPDRADALNALVATTQANKHALVHGDVSPKNILAGPAGPVFLDAECAWWGDPAFDLAFCLNHLLLKCVWNPAASEGFLACFDALATAYLAGVDWEPPASAGSTCRTFAPRIAAGTGGWQVAGRIHHARTGQGPGSTHRAGASGSARRSAWRGAPGLGEGALMTDTRIAFVHGRRIWDSRGRPTVEADVLLEGGAVGRGMAPAGASTGTGEALDLRDGGAKQGGYDVTRAVGHVNGEIARAVVGLDAADQQAVDARLIALDGTPSKSRLGANALLSVSMAAAHAAAAAAGEPLYRYLGGPEAVTLPLPQVQIFGGGAHAGRRVDIQDFMVVCPAATSFAQALDWTAEVYRAAGSLMKEAGTLAGVADEGGWWPAFKTNEQALETLVRAIEQAGFKPGPQVAIALDIAASELGRGGKYKLALENKELDTDGLVRMLAGWVKSYPIASIEDPLGEDDDVGFAEFTSEVGARIQVVGDDFLVSQASRIREAGLRGTANAVLLKPNQRGTLTETRDAWQAAKDCKLAGIVSARSGETEDTTIVHLAVGWGVGQLKVGSFARGERMAKWNEALRIEEALSVRAKFAGGAVLGRSRRGA